MTTNLLQIKDVHDVTERVRKAALLSLRAPLSTALVAAIGFIPAAISSGTGSEVQKPLATVVIGGLIIAMLVSMVALPAMLLLVARQQQASGADRRENDDEEHDAERHADDHGHHGH